MIRGASTSHCMAEKNTSTNIGPIHKNLLSLLLVTDLQLISAALIMKNSPQTIHEDSPEL